ncbi:MAG: hypothetical protein IKU98_08175 [Bacteroidaceae bacterium]|nr:hypothetical protein [Bacteroidaceae bacterium]
MAVYSIGMSAIVGLLVFLFSPHITEMLLDIAKVVTSMFGSDGRMLVHEIRMDARNGEYWNTLYKVVGCITYLWLVVGPLVQYIVLSVKKRVIQSSWSNRSSLLLCLYLVGVMLVVVIGSYKDFLGFLFAVVGLYALPYLFKEIDFKHLLTRGEASYIMLLLVLIACYIEGSNISRQAVVAVVSLPAVCYAIFNYSCCRRPTYQEITLVVLGSMTFWMAQYTTDMLRILLLLLSLGLIGVVLRKFVNATHRKWRGVVLYLFVAFIVPISCLGYNPYSAMHVSRHYDYVGYLWGERGLMRVYGRDGFGLRDRYGMVTPLQRGSIEFIDSWKPFVKIGSRGLGWNLYDIERQEFITDVLYEDIQPYGENVIRLQKDSCCHYVVYEKYYSWGDEKMHYVVTDSIP